MKEILKKLCVDRGVSGSETEMYDTVKELIGPAAEITCDRCGNIIVSMGDKNADKHIMLDAHIDRIGLIVTYISDEGFIKAEPVGGIDVRTLAGSTVTVLGKEEITAVICTVPPHLSTDDSTLKKDNIWIDTGLPCEKVKKLVSLGDRIILYSRFTELQNDRIAVSALDNRSGCAALIRCARLISRKKIQCRVSFVFSVQEETSELGAAAAAFSLQPDEAVVVDVGFASQKGVAPEKSGRLGCGGIISICPVLSREVTDKLINISKRMELECDYEVCGRSTGTNADKISCSGRGVKTGVISIPSKNMHTQTELVSLEDIDNIAKLLAVYITEGGAVNA